MSQSEVKLSVIVPLYNASETVIAALESILNTGAEALEIIVVDDGSRDSGLALVRAFRDSHEETRIVVVQHPLGANLGVSKTRNHGASLASGKYLAFLDADDLYLPHRFHGSLQILDERPELAAVFGRFKYVIAGGNDTEALRGISREQSNHQDNEILPDPSEEDLLSQLLRGASGIHTSTVTIRKSVFMQAGGFPDLKYCEDQALWLKVLGNFAVERIEGSPLSLYRIHNSSLCGIGNDRPEFIFGPVFAKLNALRWLKRHGASAGTVRKVRESISGRLFHQYSKVQSAPRAHRVFMRNLMFSAILELPELLLDRRFYSILFRLQYQ